MNKEQEKGRSLLNYINECREDIKLRYGLDESELLCADDKARSNYQDCMKDGILDQSKIDQMREQHGMEANKASSCYRKTDKTSLHCLSGKRQFNN